MWKVPDTELIDRLVLTFGPAAAFPGRPPLLGQDLSSGQSSPYVVRSQMVTFTLGSEACAELCDTALAVARGAGVRRARLLRRFVSDLSRGRPQRVPVAATAFAVLADASHAVSLRHADSAAAAAARVAAEECLAASVDLLAACVPARTRPSV